MSNLPSVHTPGPWLVHHEPNTILRDKKGRIIAALDYLQDHYPIRWRKPSEIAANEILIAAAPELLECLSELVDFSIDDARHFERSKAARKAAYELRNRLTR